MCSVCERKKPRSLETFALGDALSSDSLVAQTAKNLPARQETPGSSPGLGRSPGEGNGNPLQYSCLEKSMDRGARWATVLGVAKSQTTE